MSHAMFLDWIKLQTLLEHWLKALLHREIEAIPFQDWDYWDVEITPVSVEEMKLLLDAVETDDEDRKITSKQTGHEKASPMLFRKSCWPRSCLFLLKRQYRHELNQKKRTIDKTPCVGK